MIPELFADIASSEFFLGEPELTEEERAAIEERYRKADAEVRAELERAEAER